MSNCQMCNHPNFDFKLGCGNCGYPNLSDKSHMTEPKALADELESAIQITIRKRDETGRVVSESLMLPHRNIIVAALRSLPDAPRGREEIGQLLRDIETAYQIIEREGVSRIRNALADTPQRLRAAILALPPAPADGDALGVAQASRPRDFLAWAVKMFGPVAKLRSERLLRFVEEAIELAHAEGMERLIFDLVADRVYSRPAGNVGREIGQAQACLEMFAENIGLSSDAEAQREWTRVQEIPQEEWTRRHSAKQALGIALPSTAPDDQRHLEDMTLASNARRVAIETFVCPKCGTRGTTDGKASTVPSTEDK